MKNWLFYEVAAREKANRQTIREVSPEEEGVTERRLVTET